VLQLAVSFVFSAKQTSYYYRRGGKGKEGLFSQHLFQVNRLEETCDLSLCFMSGVELVAAVVSRPAWFFAVAGYSVLVVARVWGVLLRPVFAKRFASPASGSVRKAYSESH